MKFSFKALMVFLLISPFSLAHANDLICVTGIETIYQNNSPKYQYKSIRIKNFDLQKLNRTHTLEYITHYLPYVPYKIITNNIPIRLDRNVNVITKKQVRFSQAINNHNYFIGRDSHVIIKTINSSIGIEFITFTINSELYGPIRLFGNQCMMGTH